MRTQHWLCNRCEKVDGVLYDQSDPPEMIAHKIGRAHRLLSPHCPADIHIIPDDLYKSWWDIYNDDGLPAWAVTKIAQVLGYGDQIPK